MLRDEAKCFLDAGGLIEVSDMVLRMLRIALPTGDGAWADGQALILLRATCGWLPKTEGPTRSRSTPMRGLRPSCPGPTDTASLCGSALTPQTAGWQTMHM